MKITPGKWAIQTFGPGAPADVAHECNAFVEGHDLERQPIVQNTFNLSPVDGDMTLTIVLVVASPPPEARGAPAIQRVDRIPFGPNGHGA